MDVTERTTNTAGSAAQKPLENIRDISQVLLRGPLEELQFDGPEKPTQKISLNKVQELEQRVRNTPADPEPYIELAQYYKEQKRWQDVRRVVDRGVANNEDSSELLELREDIMLELSHQSLIAARTELSRRKSDDTRKQYEECEIDLANLRVKVCTARLKRDPKQVELLIPWAIALRQLGRHEEAVERLSEASRSPEIRAHTSLQLGMCYQFLGKTLDALSAYRRAAFFRAPPPSPEIRQRTLELAGDLAEESGLYDSAIGYAKKLLECSPKSEQAEVIKRIEKLEALFRDDVE